MKISVIGAGYVGLVSSVCLAELGHSINLIELEKQKVEVINSGRTPIHENGLHPLLAAHIGRNLRVTTGYDGIPYSDISLICVGTPPYPDGGANLSMVEASSRSIGKALRERGGYHIVAVKSTIPPRTTQDLIMPTVLEQSGKSLDDLGFVVNPEFLREGLAVEDFMVKKEFQEGCG